MVLPLICILYGIDIKIIFVMQITNAVCGLEVEIVIIIQSLE